MDFFSAPRAKLFYWEFFCGSALTANDDHDLSSVRHIAAIPVMCGIHNNFRVVKVVGPESRTRVVRNNFRFCVALYNEHMVERPGLVEVRIFEQTTRGRNQNRVAFDTA